MANTFSLQIEQELNTIKKVIWTFSYQLNFTNDKLHWVFSLIWRKSGNYKARKNSKLSLTAEKTYINSLEYIISLENTLCSLTNIPKILPYFDNLSSLISLAQYHNLPDSTSTLSIVWSWLVQVINLVKHTLRSWVEKQARYLGKKVDFATGKQYLLLR